MIKVLLDGGCEKKGGVLVTVEVGGSPTKARIMVDLVAGVLMPWEINEISWTSLFHYLHIVMVYTLILNKELHKEPNLIKSFQILIAILIDSLNPNYLNNLTFLT